jgi:hypothetical protein
MTTIYETDIIVTGLVTITASLLVFATLVLAI